jgi:hypothetical protein
VVIAIKLYVLYGLLIFGMGVAYKRRGQEWRGNIDNAIAVNSYDGEMHSTTERHALEKFMLSQCPPHQLNTNEDNHTMSHIDSPYTNHTYIYIH